MKLFGKRKPRNVGAIVSGLTAIVNELDESINTNTSEKEVCAEDRGAEMARHNDALAAIDERNNELDAELNQAATVKENLSTLLGLE